MSRHALSSIALKLPQVPADGNRVEMPTEAPGPISSAAQSQTHQALDESLANSIETMTQPAEFSATTSRHTSRLQWPRIVAFAAAVLLLVSAVLKTLSPTEAATLATAYQIPLWLTAVVVQIELMMAVVLLAEIRLRSTLLAVALLFSLFSIFSGYRVWLGAESCGCFGPVKVPPLITTALDLCLAAAAALASRLVINEQARPGCFKAAGVAYAVAGVLAVLVFCARVPTTATALSVQAEGELVILDPESWVGKAFPLSRHLVPEVDISSGDWVVLFFHHDCPDCQAAIPRYDALASDYGRHVLLVEVPPCGPRPPAVRAAKVARLTDDNEWFVQAPIEMTIARGIVAGASLELPAIAQAVHAGDD